MNILAQPVTLGEYTQSIVNQCKMPECNIIDSGDTILANNPAYKLVYTMENQQQSQYPSMTFMGIWTIKDNKLYLLAYKSEAYSKY